MTISKQDFDNALRKLVSSGYSDIPNEDDHRFSDRFTKQMEKLIRRQKKSYWKFINTTAKKTAVILVAIFTLAAASLSVKAIREPFVKFIIEVYETFARYFYAGDTTAVIEKEYSITVLPPGFVQTNQTRDSTALLTTYADSNNPKNMIVLEQGVTNDGNVDIDTEHGSSELFKVENLDVSFFEREGQIQAIWATDSYIFCLTCYGDMGRDSVIAIISSIEAK